MSIHAHIMVIQGTETQTVSVATTINSVGWRDSDTQQSTVFVACNLPAKGPTSTHKST